MLRCIFVGSPNLFTSLMVHWLAKHTDLRGVVWTSSAHWATSVSGKVQFAKRRLKRVGLLKTIDEAMFYALSKNVLNDTGLQVQNRLFDLYVREHGVPEWSGDSVHTSDINSPEVVTFVRERSVDLIMSMCINEFFRREIRQTPRLGAFLWHEGIAPEYKGLYSPFWAIHNGEPEQLGYTVLRMNERYDEGEIFLQGPAENVNLQTDNTVYIGHKAILDSLPAVEGLFNELEQGAARPIATVGRKPATYTYPGFTNWVRYRSQVRNLARKAVDESHVAPLSAKDF
jgi:hypothetical protein